ncbi:OLC1v1009617C1 [Oldenlandia corymbosa var. corymbosa]|uniref:OLC1v1009617C1 n=1 Tax=Oldenlandia corymbosa var. corymbosa TaxID=529605 RepID=A0AAV1DPD4_OLDCO|nr:OLC1v1009617C1 [Oldenlandia corymbosa var. corymbosa]
MKFGKEFASQMVQEWQEAYMDYSYLKTLLKDVLNFRRVNNISSSGPNSDAQKSNQLKRRLSLYRTFSGLTRLSWKGGGGGSPNNKEDEVILVSEVQQSADAAGESDGFYQTMFLMSSDETGELELVFFRKLDEEFNKVVKFYREKVSEVKAEAEELSKQMDALIALRIKVDYPLMEFIKTDSSRNHGTIPSQVQSAASSSDGIRRGK